MPHRKEKEKSLNISKIECHSLNFSNTEISQLRKTGREGRGVAVEDSAKPWQVGCWRWMLRVIPLVMMTVSMIIPLYLKVKS